MTIFIYLTYPVLFVFSQITLGFGIATYLLLFKSIELESLKIKFKIFYHDSHSLVITVFEFQF
ncbi:unnamed protein product (macronuclear) [Paramecium tetraurelia]|uniref:Chromosome undetermined scaffold_101, whole genome shotgun sequence n=1 Tax=Paramecium tetraurelia TaxID=5888 RepID=A0BDY2_PARTE|nr:uncharacterized protein GSPATT00027780001 [Paramecium tetraurelia]XP_001441639.1 uncharacterized protein GSPATT00038975001 [Paramecium tetraurelia]CAK56749.1 unnamed protein product [Paramecium tetraurelia]CAK74242.1 unnamed protein product [Paramecium tetraurelia]|eukprot:XP_001424147.1 hypothetical protein (macronuclear) [Paramecium tetraurelia strain d4-2]